MAARGSIRAVGRALGKEYAVCDRIAKMIPKIPDITIEEAMEDNLAFGEIYKSDDEVREIVDAAIAVEGLPSNVSTHAAGVLITPEAVRSYVPLWLNKGKNGKPDVIVASFDMVTLEELGLLKMDFLGLKTLGVIDMTLKNIRVNYGKEVSKWDLLDAVNEPEPYQLISEGKTQGIFQLEGQGMSSTARELKPQNMEELTALISLYRPGPMDSIPQYIHNKNHQNEITYPFYGDSKEVLEETYGVLCYQEQVMRLARTIAGYSMSFSDDLRRAIGKKKIALIQEHKEYFIHGKKDDAGNVLIPGGTANKYSESELTTYYDNVIVPFGRYAFNKPHGGSYAVISAQTAWLKYHYPEEFMASLLTFNFSDKDKIPIYIRHCKVDLGISIVNPDINLSKSAFVPLTNHSIVFGLSALKGVGMNVIDDIVIEREKNGLFKSFTDFIERMVGYNNLNRTACESLIQAGAFDFTKETRTQLLYVLDDIKDVASKFKSSWNSGQLQLFIPPRPNEDTNLPNIVEYPERIRLKVEKEVSNIYISGHPLDMANRYINEHQTIFARDLEIVEEEDDNYGEEFGEAIDRVALYDQKPVEIVCMMTSIRSLKTKKGDMMAFMEVEDPSGFTSITIFPKTYEKYNHLFTDDKILHIKGVLNFYNGEYKIVADYIKEVVDPKFKYLYINANNISELKPIIKLLEENSKGDYAPKVVHNNWSVLLPQKYWASEKTIETLKYLNYNIKIDD